MSLINWKLSKDRLPGCISFDLLYGYFCKNPELELDVWSAQVKDIGVLTATCVTPLLAAGLEPKEHHTTWTEWLKAAPKRIFSSLF